MGLDMFLYRATKAQKKALDSLYEKENALEEKWGGVLSKNGLEDYYRKDEDSFTDKQKKILADMRSEYDENCDKIRAIKDEMNPADVGKDYNGGYIGYWRKFNALHAYIVNTFGGGVDECQEIELSKQDIYMLLDVASRSKELLGRCKKVVSEEYEGYYIFDIEVVDLPLKPQRGFFFGPQEIDTWYEKQVNYSVELFKKILNEWSDDQVVWYRASW